MSEKLKDMLKKHEGFRTKPYLCSMNFLTIGYGRNLDAKGISELEAMVLLENDVAEAKEQAEKKFPWFKNLNEARQDVIIDLIFNLGISGFSKFKMTISFLEAENYEQAAIELLESTWAEQVPNRAKELSRMMFNGKYD